MNQLVLEAICVSLCRDAQLLGVARPDELAVNIDLLEAAQDELARAMEKARHGLQVAA